jgi:hypothetical protein
MMRVLMRMLRVMLSSLLLLQHHRVVGCTPHVATDVRIEQRHSGCIVRWRRRRAIRRKQRLRRRGWRLWLQHVEWLL